MPDPPAEWPQAGPERRPRRTHPGSRNAIFAVSSLALLLASIDATIVATALTTITRELHTSLGLCAWTISAYMLGSVAANPIAGRLSDSLGRKRMFLIFIGIFTASSLCCGLALNIDMLIGLRVIQALGGGGLMPSAAGVIADQFGEHRDRPIGLLSSIFPLGALIGPALGGLIVTYASWRLIFFVNVPVGIVLVLSIWRLLPADDLERKRKLEIDFIGSALLALTILALMLGLQQLGQAGFASAPPWLLLAAAVALGVGFMRRQEHSPYPILPPVLLTQRSFALVNGLNLLYGAAAFGAFSLVPTYAQIAFGIGPLAAGGLLAFRALAMAVLSTLTSIFVIVRFGYRGPMLAGFVVLAVGLTVLAVSPIGLSPYMWLALACFLCGAGVGIAGPPSNNASLQLMPSQIAAISGLRSMFRQTGGIVAISIIAAIIVANARGARVLPYVFAALAVITLIGAPAIWGVPENAARNSSSEPAPRP